MKVYNTPAQAKNLREIEAASLASSVNVIPEVHGTVQPIQPEEASETEETGQEAETESSTKKARQKKNTETV